MSKEIYSHITGDIYHLVQGFCEVLDCVTAHAQDHFQIPVLDDLARLLGIRGAPSVHVFATFVRRSRAYLPGIFDVALLRLFIRR